MLGLEGITPATQAVIGKRLARVFEEELADVAKAEETYRYVLTVAPREPEALANLDRIYTSLEQWSELAGVLEQRATAAPETSEQVELLTRLGEVYEERLGQIDDAIRSYRKIFDRLEPANEAAIQALGRIYEVKEAWIELKGVYERELENAVGDVQEAEIRAKLARLASERLGKVDEAIEGWKRVLDLRGEDPEALAGAGRPLRAPAQVGGAHRRSRAPLRHRRNGRRPGSHPDAASAALPGAAGTGRRGARDLAARPRHRSVQRGRPPRHRPDLAYPSRPAGAGECARTPPSIGRRRCSSRPSYVKSTASSGGRTATSSAQPTRQPRRGGASSRSIRPTSRRWTSSKRATARRSGGPTSST